MIVILSYRAWGWLSALLRCERTHKGVEYVPARYGRMLAQCFTNARCHTIVGNEGVHIGRFCMMSATPFHSAAACNRTRALETLLIVRSEGLKDDCFCLTTPLHMAVHRDAEDVVRMMLRQRSDSDCFYLQDSCRDTPIDLAVRYYPHTAVGRLLAASGIGMASTGEQHGLSDQPSGSLLGRFFGNNSHHECCSDFQVRGRSGRQGGMTTFIPYFVELPLLPSAPNVLVVITPPLLPPTPRHNDRFPPQTAKSKGRRDLLSRRRRVGRNGRK